MGYDDDGHWTHCEKCDSLLSDGKPSCEEHEEMRRSIAALEAQVKDLTFEVEHGDYWRKRATAAIADGTCPICFCTDEDGHKPGCLWGQAEAERDALRARLQWNPMETAPKGNGDKINDTRDPRWVDPPRLLLLFPMGEVSVACWDWFYAPGGRGHIGTIPWVEPVSGELVALSYEAPVAWMEIPAALAQSKPEKGGE